MNENGAVMERYWQGKTDVLGKKIGPTTSVFMPNPMLTNLESNPIVQGERKEVRKKGLRISPVSSFSYSVL
jgi:hypothetical protein